MVTRKRIFRLSLTCLYIFLLVSVTACSTAAGGKSTPTPLPPLVDYEQELFTVEMGSIVSEQELIGEVVPAKQDELFFRASGFVTRLAARSGDTVKKGDVLAEQQVDDLVNQLEQARIDLEVAQANLAKETSQRQYEIEKAKADVIIWENRLELAKMEVENTYGQAKKRAEIELAITEQNLALAQQALDLISEDVTTFMEQSVKRSELAVQRLEALLAERQIVAPYDCIVLKSVIRPGQQVDAYYVAFQVGDPTELVVRSQYDYELGRSLQPNSEVHLYFDNEDDAESYPIKFLPNFLPFTETEGTTSTTNVDFLYFSVPEGVDRELISAGQSVSLVVVLGRKENALLLPPAAIREYKGFNFVIVQDQDRRRRVEINEIGLKSSDRWEVIADLEEGDQVLGP